jgi:hypothetical protein
MPCDSSRLAFGIPRGILEDVLFYWGGGKGVFEGWGGCGCETLLWWRGSRISKIQQTTICRLLVAVFSRTSFYKNKSLVHITDYTGNMQYNLPTNRVWGNNTYRIQNTFPYARNRSRKDFNGLDSLCLRRPPSPGDARRAAFSSAPVFLLVRLCARNASGLFSLPLSLSCSLTSNERVLATR